MPDVDLSLVDTDDLIAELKRRHDGLLVVRMANQTTDRGAVYHHFGGTAIAAVGLARYAEAAILHDLLATPEED